MNSFTRRFAAHGWLIALLVVLESGCMGVHRVKVNAVARPDAAEHISYSVRGATPTSRGTMIDSEAANYVRTALSAKGMYEASKGETPDLEVIFVYDSKQHKETYKREVSHSSPTNAEPGDWHTRSITEITYEKSLYIVATEKNPAPNTPARVWHITVVDENDDPSLEKAMPLLAAAGCDRIGTNTDGPITIRLREKDEVVSFIKRGM